MNARTLRVWLDARAQLLHMQPGPNETTTHFLARFAEVRKTAELDKPVDDRPIVDHLMRVLPAAQVAAAIKAFRAEKRSARKRAAADTTSTPATKQQTIARIRGKRLTFDDFRALVEAEAADESPKHWDDDMKLYEYYNLIKKAYRELDAIEAADRASNLHTTWATNRAVMLRRAQCFKCGVRGHIARSCLN